MTETMYDNGTPLLMPQDKMSERALLGALLVDNAAILPATTLVGPTDFYVESNGLLFLTMVDLATRNEPADVITIMGELRKHGRAEIGEGQDRAESYLAKLMVEVQTSKNESRIPSSAHSCSGQNHDAGLGRIRTY